VSDFHTIDPDDPFFDGELGHQSLAMRRREGMDLVYPAETTYVGSVGYSMTADIVERACAIKTTDDTEMMWHHVERVPGLRTGTLLVPEASVREARLTLDYEEDYWLLRTLLRIVGPGAGRRDIDRLFIRNPALGMVNWFRNAEWHARQQASQG
jgi:spore coat polysaccharide biosynthesis protein SpsF (cytidylyltransferase family)